MIGVIYKKYKDKVTYLNLYTQRSRGFIYTNTFGDRHLKEDQAYLRISIVMNGLPDYHIRGEKKENMERIFIAMDTTIFKKSKKLLR